MCVLHNISMFIGRWHEFGRMHDKLLIGMLTGFGSVFIVYLFYTPRKVGKTNTISSIPSTNHFISSEIFLKTYYSFAKYRSQRSRKYC